MSTVVIPSSQAPESTQGPSSPKRRHLIEGCRLCPKKCEADRLNGGVGACGARLEARLASATVHIGEEPPISGTRGSATFFFSHCPLSCAYCQNFPISQIGHGRDVTIEEMAGRMTVLEKRGAHNINIVTGTPHVPHIIEAVALARHLGLACPVVWNTSGYETLETIDLLKDTVDIYLTDIKYGNDDIALSLSDAPDYFRIATAAARRMLDQVGPLETDDRDIGRRGVIIRHLVLPDGLSNTERVMSFIATHYGKKVPVSLMGQYFPAHRASTLPAITRPVTRVEYARARQMVRDAGITRGWFQEMDDPACKRGA